MNDIEHQVSLLSVPLIDRLEKKPVIERSKREKFINQLLIFLVVAIACVRVVCYVRLLDNVNMKFKYNGVDIYDNDIITFTYQGLIQVFWRAKAYSMAILIIMGEYLLPFFTYFMFILYLLEQNKQFLIKNHPFWRDMLELVITFIEFCTKFSLTDIMIQSILQRVIFTDVTLVKLATNKEFSVLVSAAPKPALALSIFTTVSLILIFRVAEVNNYGNKEDTIIFRKASDMKRKFCCKVSSTCRSMFVKIIMIGLCFLSFYSLYNAFNYTLLRFRITGLLGQALKEEDAIKSYFLIDIPQFFVGTAVEENKALSIILANYVYVTLIMLPIIYTLAAMIWIFGSVCKTNLISSSVLRVCEVVLDFTLSNSNLEVTFCAASAAFVELPTMARFLLNDLYPLVCSFIHDSVDTLQCIDLDRSIEVGYYWLLLAIIIKQVLTSYIYFKRS